MTESATPNRGADKQPQPDAKSLGIEGKKGKFLVLANAMIWRHESGFELSWISQTRQHWLSDNSLSTDVQREDLAERRKAEDKAMDPALGNWWVPIEDVPTNNADLINKINLALKQGTLVMTDSYEAWLIENKSKRNRQAKRTHRLVWAETDRDAVQKQEQVPRGPSIASGTLTYADKDSEAYKLLQKNADKLRTEIPQIVGGMDRELQREFTQQLLRIEQSGFNRSASARPSVVDTIVRVRADMGLASGLTPVVEDKPITTDVKPLRLIP